MSHRSLIRLVLSWGLIAGAGGAEAAVGVFVDAVPNSVCTNSGAIVIGNTASPIVLDLCVVIGSNHSNNACRTNSNGDDICAFQVGVQLEGTGFVSNFQPTSGVRYWPQTFTTSTRAMKFAYVGGQPQPAAAGPFKIGTLTVNAIPVGGTRVLSVGHQVVDSGLQLRLVPSATLATLPEPGCIAQLVSGALALALLHCAHRRHER